MTATTDVVYKNIETETGSIVIINAGKGGMDAHRQRFAQTVVGEARAAHDL